MSSWSIDMVRQSGWDLWVLVCVAASLVLLSYMLLSARSLLTLVLGSIGIFGTLVIVLLPSLHQPSVGLVWTFCLLSILSATFYLSLRDQLSITRIAVLLSMRIAALALLVPMLFEPVVRFVAKPKPERPLLFLIDTSGSMSFPDAQNGPTRLQAVWQALRPELETINEHFVPTYAVFDTHSRELKSPDELALMQADGKSTDIVGAITTALSKTTRDDAAVVLLTDGIDNTSPNAADAVRASSHPIHTIRVGSDQAEPASVANVAVDNIESPDDFIVNHETTIKATIKSTGLANRVVDVNMSEIDENGKNIGELKTQKLVLQPTAEGQIVELPYKPKTVGLHKVAVWIDPVAGERSIADNRQEFQGLAIDPRMKVLYIEGSIRLEYKWTRQAFISDSNIELATFLRKSNTEVEAGGTVDGEPFKALPTTAEGWKKFDVIIIGDIDSTYLSPLQQQRIEQRISNGAGLLMLGGQNSFGPGGYQDTPIEKALPVFVGDKSAGQDKKSICPPSLTEDGYTHPILDGLTDWFGIDNKPGAKILPADQRQCHRLQTQKRRASVDDPSGSTRPRRQTRKLFWQPNITAKADPRRLLSIPRISGSFRCAVWARKARTTNCGGQMIRWLAGQDVRDRQRGAGLEALPQQIQLSTG